MKGALLTRSLRRKVLLAASVLLTSCMLISLAGAATFSVTVTPERLWPGEPVDVVVNTVPESVGAIFVWKPIVWNGEPIIGDWCDFLDVLYDSGGELIFCADILIFDSCGIEARYPETWKNLLANEKILDPCYFDPCEFDPQELPMVLWGCDGYFEELQGWVYEAYSGPNTNQLGKYFVAIFAVDAEWVESLMNILCGGIDPEEEELLYGLICDPTWIGAFITTFLVIPEFPLGTVTAVVAPLLAFTTLSTLQRKRRCTR